MGDGYFTNLLRESPASFVGMKQNHRLLRNVTAYSWHFNDLERFNVNRHGRRLLFIEYDGTSASDIGDYAR